MNRHVTAGHLAGVSEREAEVLAALGEHLSNAQIASRMHISIRTVESHVSSLLRKFQVDDRRALAAVAAEGSAARAQGSAARAEGSAARAEGSAARAERPGPRPPAPSRAAA